MRKNCENFKSLWLQLRSGWLRFFFVRQLFVSLMSSFKWYKNFWISREKVVVVVGGSGFQLGQSPREPICKKKDLFEVSEMEEITN